MRGIVFIITAFNKGTVPRSLVMGRSQAVISHGQAARGTGAHTRGLTTIVPAWGVPFLSWPLAACAL